MEEKTRKRKRRIWPWVLLGLAVTFGTLIASTSVFLVSHKFDTRTFDLSPYLGSATNMFESTTATVGFSISSHYDGYRVTANGMLLDWPYTLKVDVVPAFRFFGVDVKGDVNFSLDDTPWRLWARFSASSSGDWRVEDARLDATAFSDGDPVIRQILSRVQIPAVSNLVFNGDVAIRATAERTKKVPVPRWSASCKLANVALSCFVGEQPVVVENMRLNVGALGIADYVDIMPIRPRAECIMASGFTFSNVFATVHVEEHTITLTNATASATGPTTTNIVERMLMVSEAGASCCGGDARLYSFVNGKKMLKATIALDGVDAGDVLMHLKGFNGEASGRLYGKLPITYLKADNRFELKYTYLHSVPGEKGRLKIFDAKPFIDNMALGGMQQEDCDNLSKALTDLSYDVFKLSLYPEEDGRQALSVKLVGKYEHDLVTIPVSLEITFHSNLDSLLKEGLKAIRKKKKLTNKLGEMK